MSNKNNISWRRRSFAFALGALLLLSTPAHAAWTILGLPNLQNNSPYFGANTITHLPDGRYIFGNETTLRLQNSFGLAGDSVFASTPSVDPSFVSVWDATNAVIGAGGFGSSSLYGFDPTNTSTSFTTTGSSLQNYHATHRNATSLYVGGTNGAGGVHALSYVTLDGSSNKVIIDNISSFSGGFDVDRSTGDLYVASQTGEVRMFTSAQVDGAIAGTALDFSAGSFVNNFGGSSSIAVDGAGRVWAAGFGITGIKAYDPNTGQETTYVPGLNNQIYQVTKFSDGVDDYIGYVNQGGYSPGSSLSYGYDLVSNLAVPEPTSGSLLLVGAAALALLRRRRG